MLRSSFSYPLRLIDGWFSPLPERRTYPAQGEYVIHFASIVSNYEFASTLCGRSFGSGHIFEAPIDAIVTCVRCLAADVESRMVHLA